MRCFLAALVLAMALGCTRQPAPAAESAPDLRLAVVTDLKGYLEPCGCTSNPLGGIDRLAAQVERLRKEGAPVLLLLAGDTFFDAADLDPQRVDQAKRNAATLSGIVERLGATAVLPGRRDRAQSVEIRSAIEEGSTVPWLAMTKDVEIETVRAGPLRVAVVGVRPGVDAAAALAAIGAPKDGTDLTIALVDGSRRDANRVGAHDSVDFVIQGGLDEDAPMPPRPAGDAWVFHASRQGQGLVVVDIERAEGGGPFADRSEWSRMERAGQLDRQIRDLARKIDTWEQSGDVDPSDLEPQRERLAGLRRERSSLEQPPGPASGSWFAAQWVPLPKKAPRDPEVEKRMRAHDKAVNEANRVAFAELKPPPLGPNDIAYVGSAECAPCHMTAFSWWRNHAHGVAYLTLQQRNKEFNLDCVGCHVTGYQEPGGSTVTHNLDGALVNVGCESCHGPGAGHVENPAAPMVRKMPESGCVTCHNEQHSDLFDYEEYVKRIVVPGHGLPPQ